MPRRRLRKLPSKHVFPGGFTVVIESVPRNTEVLTPGGDRIEPLGDDDFGIYHTDQAGVGVIYLWDQLTPKQAWNTLMHELIHCLVDAQNYVEKSK